MKLDIKEVTHAWINLAIGNEEVKKIAEERMKVCIECPFREKQLGVFVCSLCMCPLIAKTHSPKNSCDKWFWKR